MTELPAWTPIRIKNGKPRGYRREYGCMTAEVRCDGDPEWGVWGAGTFPRHVFVASLGPYVARSIWDAARAAALVAMALDKAFEIAVGADEETHDE